MTTQSFREHDPKHPYVLEYTYTVCWHGRPYSEPCVDCEIVGLHERHRYAARTIASVRDRLRELGAPMNAELAGPLNELEELNLLNKLIDLGARAAAAHAKAQSDDGHTGTAAYVEFRELRADMGEMIRNAYAAPTTAAQGVNA